MHIFSKPISVMTLALLSSILIFLLNESAVTGSSARAKPSKTGYSVPKESMPWKNRFHQKACETSKAKGIKWLLGAQNTDGSWGMDEKSKGDAASTAFVMLSLMSEGSTPTRGEYAKPLQKAMHWLSQEIQKKSDLSYNNSTQWEYKLGQKMQNYMVATVLAELCGMEPKIKYEETKLTKQMKEMAKNISKWQHDTGGWDDGSTESLVTTVTAWLALRGAHESGVWVGEASVDNVLEFVKKTYEPNTGLFKGVRGGYGYQIWFSSTSCALRILYGHGEGDSEIARNATKALLKETKTFAGRGGGFGGAGGEDYISAFFITHALRNSEEFWMPWFDFITETLLKLQNNDGSWTGRHCIVSRTICTAASVLTLSSPGRMLPMMER